MKGVRALYHGSHPRILSGVAQTARILEAAGRMEGSARPLKPALNAHGNNPYSCWASISAPLPGHSRGLPDTHPAHLAHARHSPVLPQGSQNYILKT